MTFIFILPVIQTKGSVFTCLLCALQHFTEHHLYLISFSTGGAVLPSPTAPSLAMLAQQRANIKKTSS